MKAKVKNLDAAKKLGLKGIKQLIKKELKEPILEATWFFYDAKFEYGAGKNDIQPLFYIGPKITPWKIYSKEKKQDPFFTEGMCISDSQGRIKLVPASGKGGKPKVIKIVNKELLKPFAKAFLVENFDTPLPEEANQPVASNEDTATTDETTDTTPAFDLAALENEVDILTEEGLAAIAELNPIVASLEEPLTKLKDTIVTDDLIQEAATAIETINKYQLVTIATMLKKWLKDATKRYADEASAAPLIKKVEDLTQELTDMAKKLSPIEKNAIKIQKVKNPTEGEVALVSDDPLENIANQFAKIHSASTLNTYHTGSQKFK